MGVYALRTLLVLLSKENWNKQVMKTHIFNDNWCMALCKIENLISSLSEFLNSLSVMHSCIFQIR